MLRKLLKYTEQADALYIQTFLAAGRQVPAAEAMFSHILNAQHIWVNRILGSEPEHERFAVHPLSLFDQLHRQNMLKLTQVVSEKDLQEIISYRFSTGDTASNTIEDILLQVINHSTYHRAQVATLLKLQNIQPPVTDFIALKRQGLI